MTRANTMSLSVHTHIPGRMQISAALLLLRTGSALAFLYHGGDILLGAFGGRGPEAFAASHHWPLAIAYLVGLAQVAGGLAIVSGILFRLGAASLLMVMLGALFLVHLPHGFDVSNGVAGFPLPQLFLAVAVCVTHAAAHWRCSWFPPWPPH